MLKTKTWALLLGGVLALSALASVYVLTRKPETAVVRVVQNGVCLREIDLSAVEEPYTFVVEDPDGGSNTVRVEPGRICVSEADCPDQTCVRRGWSDGGGAPIVCLPHRLVIEAAEPGGLDAVAE